MNLTSVVISEQIIAQNNEQIEAMIKGETTPNCDYYWSVLCP
jgi:hypothetical protein